MGGELDGVRLLSPETVAAFSTVRVKSPDAISEDGPGALLVPRTLGYIGNFAVPGNSRVTVPPLRRTGPREVAGR